MFDKFVLNKIEKDFNDYQKIKWDTFELPHRYFNDKCYICHEYSHNSCECKTVHLNPNKLTIIKCYQKHENYI